MKAEEVLLRFSSKSEPQWRLHTNLLTLVSRDLPPGSPESTEVLQPGHQSKRRLFWRGSELWLVPHGPFFGRNYMLPSHSHCLCFERSEQPAPRVSVLCQPLGGHHGCLGSSADALLQAAIWKRCFLKKPGLGCLLKPFTSRPFISCPTRSVTGSWSEGLTTAH